MRGDTEPKRIWVAGLSVGGFSLHPPHMQGKGREVRCVCVCSAHTMCVHDAPLSLPLHCFGPRCRPTMCCMNREAGSCVGSSSHLIYAGMVGSLRARTNKASWRRCWWRFPSFEMTYPVTSSLAWLYEEREKERGFGVRQRRRESEEETGHDTYARDMTSKTQKGRERETQRIREAQIRARTRLRVDGEGGGEGWTKTHDEGRKKAKNRGGKGAVPGDLGRSGREGEGEGVPQSFGFSFLFASSLSFSFWGGWRKRMQRTIFGGLEKQNPLPYSFFFLFFLCSNQGMIS
ncbi:hypothetical protein LY78DRAFT_317320 [Colletotrichum sublineola]|nr:hypothetical protein LY78DRAFT_317320 [Colletotrichum sublineola]